MSRSIARAAAAGNAMALMRGLPSSQPGQAMPARRVWADAQNAADIVARPQTRPDRAFLRA